MAGIPLFNYLLDTCMPSNAALNIANMISFKWNTVIIVLKYDLSTLDFYQAYMSFGVIMFSLHKHISLTVCFKYWSRLENSFEHNACTVCSTTHCIQLILSIDKATLFHFSSTFLPYVMTWIESSLLLFRVDTSGSLWFSMFYIHQTTLQSSFLVTVPGIDRIVL